MNLNDLSPREVIAQYILACRNKGLCLTYREYELIDSWLGACQGDTEAVLLILDELLPPFFAADQAKRLPKPISHLHRTVLRRLAERPATAQPTRQMDLPDQG